VVARIVEEAQCEGTALSELERKIKDVFSNNLYSWRECDSEPTNLSRSTAKPNWTMLRTSICRRALMAAIY